MQINDGNRREQLSNNREERSEYREIDEERTKIDEIYIYIYMEKGQAGISVNNLLNRAKQLATTQSP